LVSSEEILSEGNIEQMVALLKKTNKVRAAYVHGSVLGPLFNKESDLDIAVLLSNGNLSSNQRMILSTELEEVVRVPVDLGVLSSQNLVYAVQVIEKGRLLFTDEENGLKSFITNAMSGYAQLCYERRGIVKAYSHG
tara:strand:- start:185 stop:595 length:411 start_codon:yes stop_codon:yes gene_type:complete